MPDAPTDGIRHPERPSHYLVPPWSPGATLTEVVTHFARHHPWDDTNPRHLFLYFQAYHAALHAAPPERDTSTVRERWRAETFGVIARCMAFYKDKLAAENGTTDQDAVEVRRVLQGSIRQSLPASTVPMIQSR